MQKLLLLHFQVANYEETLLQISFLATTTTDQIPQNPPKIPPRKTQPTKNASKKKTLATKNSSEKNPTPTRVPPIENTQSPPIIPGIRRTQQPTRKFL
jgi:hypothetical protein